MECLMPTCIMYTFISATVITHSQEIPFSLPTNGTKIGPIQLSTLYCLPYTSQVFVTLKLLCHLPPSDQICKTLGLEVCNSR